MKNKKAFTVVELVIVIAIIAILAAVLIPTFANIIKKANVSKDQQLIRNLNTALASDKAENGGKAHANMTEALEAAKKFGYEVGKINASGTDNEILWDSKNDVFCYYDADKQSVEYIPSSVPSANAPAKESTEYWCIITEKNVDKAFTVSGTEATLSCGRTDIKWSCYLDTVPAGVDTITTATGVDAGETTALSTINYVNNGTAQAVIIRTNNIFGTLTVNAINDEVDHYGEIGDLYIIAVKKASYDEYGRVGGIAKLIYGKINVMNGGEITTIVGEPESADDIELVVKDGGLVGTVIATDAEILSVLNVAGVNNSEQIEENELESVINSECYIKGDNNVYYPTIQAAVDSANGETLIVITKDILYRDITGAAITIPQGKNITIDLNGKIVKAYLTNSASSQLISLGGASHTQKTYLTIKDKTASNDGIGTGMLYVLNAYESDPMNVATSVISANPMADVTIESGRIYNACTNSNTGMGYGMYGIDVLTNGGSNKDVYLSVSGGLVQSKNYRSIRAFCNADSSTVYISISGGTVKSEGNYAIWLQSPNAKSNRGVLSISGGSVVPGKGKLPFSLGSSDNISATLTGGTISMDTKVRFDWYHNESTGTYYWGKYWNSWEEFLADFPTEDGYSVEIEGDIINIYQDTNQYLSEYFDVSSYKTVNNGNGSFSIVKK